jgi:hypothetical protein
VVLALDSPRDRLKCVGTSTSRWRVVGFLGNLEDAGCGKTDDVLVLLPPDRVASTEFYQTLNLDSVILIRVVRCDLRGASLFEDTCHTMALPSTSTAPVAVLGFAGSGLASVASTHAFRPAVRAALSRASVRVWRAHSRRSPLGCLCSNPIVSSGHVGNAA